jgi:hypothetical protein
LKLGNFPRGIQISNFFWPNYAQKVSDMNLKCMRPLFSQKKSAKRAKKFSPSLAKESALIPIVKYLNRSEINIKINQQYQQE